MLQSRLGTKAETINSLAERITTAEILPQFLLTVGQWRSDREGLLLAMHKNSWTAQPMIVRSSHRDEDGCNLSLAGHFRSLLDVGSAELPEAIDDVIASYGEENLHNQVFVQPMLRGITMCGVAFSRDPNTGAPYLVVNYSDLPEDVTAVTGGRSNNLKTYYRCLGADFGASSPRLQAIADLASELTDALGAESLDIEFAFTVHDRPYLLQVRPLSVRDKAPVDPERHETLLRRIERKIATSSRSHPFLHGERTVYGVMPDWNPAEIIGIRPRPLALSLYRELVTDAIWAYQRSNYGYKSLRGFPLLHSFQGLPYIDVRVSFNSFIPKDVEKAFADKLVNYYIDRLLASPDLHDRVEFEIVFSCYTFDHQKRMAALLDYGFSRREIDTFSESLCRLTAMVIDNNHGLWKNDCQRIETLSERRMVILESDLDLQQKIYWLLEDTKRYGTLPFAGLARASFMAVQILRSLTTVGVLAEEEVNTYLGGLSTVGSRMAHDFYALPKGEFLARYGHLRPGTYEITSPRYDETPDDYFDWSRVVESIGREEKPFSLTLGQMREINELLRENNLPNDVVELFEFIRAGIEGREYAKFLFTRNLSDALSLIVELGADCGLSVDDLSYTEINDYLSFLTENDDQTKALMGSMARGKERYAESLQIILPPLISGSGNVWEFHLPIAKPNYITQRSVTGPVYTVDQRKIPVGGIVMIENADPGCDWIFSHSIGGFVTAYGGLNSHMAIRAHELGIPAVIGAGETLFGQWSSARRLHIDCANSRVEIIA